MQKRNASDETIPHRLGLTAKLTASFVLTYMYVGSPVAR